MCGINVKSLHTDKKATVNYKNDLETIKMPAISFFNELRIIRDVSLNLKRVSSEIRNNNIK